MLDMKSFDWRKMQRYLSPQATNDLNAFLENLPGHVGQTVLILAGAAWVAAGAFGFYTTLQLQQLTKLRAELMETKALKPNVPIIKDVPISQQDLTSFVNDLNRLYPELTIKQEGPNINISLSSTEGFGMFREAVGHVQNGGSGWRVSVEQLCVGRECPKTKLLALLRINKVSVDKI